MYSINDYEISISEHDVYVFHETKAAKISNTLCLFILNNLKARAIQEISEQELILLAEQAKVDLSQLKKLLIDQLDVIRPLYQRKFESVYINCDDSLIANLVSDSLSKHYKVHIVADDFFDFTENSLVFFYRNNYTNTEFNTLYRTLNKKVYVITAGVVGKLLVIDNIYFKGSGLATHVSNLHQLLNYLEHGLEVGKDNWLLFYRTLLKSKLNTFPEPSINACEQGFVAYCSYKFISQFTDFWAAPLTTDQLNWFWHVDLKKFSVHKEVSIHSPFSEFDMNLNLDNLKSKAELAD